MDELKRDTIKQSQPSGSRHWVLLVYGGERSYAGNPGYSDVPSAEYRFDSSVPNHKRLAAGDLVAVRTRAGIEGFAKIASISSKPGTRVRRECPQCGIPGLRERHNAVPRFRCRQGHEFDQPAEKLTECTQYVADFDRSFIRLPEALAPQFAIKMRLSAAAQQFAIQPADFSLVDAIHLPEQVRAWVAGLSGVSTLTPVDADDDRIDNPYTPSLQDSRETVLRQIRNRRGQRLFRDQLLEAFDSRCVVTGCRIVDLLEAAHIYPYRSPSDNHPSNGLLLRADIHTLFDLQLVGVDPASLTVNLHPCLQQSEYAALAGHSITVSKGSLSDASLRWRWERFIARTREER